MGNTVSEGEVDITSLEVALRSTDDNRGKLEKVLYYYRRKNTDSLKYKAACYLIKNMPSYRYSVGEQLENYKSYCAWLEKNREREPQQVADSIKKVYGPMKEPNRMRDIMKIDSTYLCHNVDWAFRVWQEQPWGKSISLDVFCEYLLSYRIGDEPLVYWREMYYAEYNSLLDILRMSGSLDVEDLVVAANYLVNKLPDGWHYYTLTTPYSFEHIGPEYVQCLSGTCCKMTDFAVYLFRALRIPCTTDFVPVRSYVNAGHFQLITWDKTGEAYVANFPENLGMVRKNWWYHWDDGPKVYGYTFDINKELYEQMTKHNGKVYSLWNLPKFMGITYEYAYSFEKELVIPSEKLYRNQCSGRIAYLCITNRDNWIPVDWTEFNARHLASRNVRKGTLVRAVTYENDTLNFLTDPFYVDKQKKEQHYFSIEGNTQDVILYAECSMEEENMLRDRMIGGIFEGSNQLDSTVSSTLFIIQCKPDRPNTTVRSSSSKEYRYIRYVDPPGGLCNVAKVAFYGRNDTLPLPGKIIGTPGCYQHDGTHGYINVFDGKTWTFFDYFKFSGGWAGLDLGRKVRVDRVVYAPRNEDNYIRPGDIYELYYCDRYWKFAGRIKSTVDSLVYRGIPQNILLFLRNHTRGVDERVFVCGKGEQLWK